MRGSRSGLKRALLSLAVVALASMPLYATNVSTTLSGNSHWTVAGSPYVITGATTLQSTATLTIDPGVTVLINYGYSFYIEGTLTAIGTAANPIVITSSLGSPYAGSWNALYFKPGAASSASQLSYAEVSYGGRYWGAIIYVEDSSPAIDHVTVSYSSQYGIQVTGASAAPTITNSTIQSSSWAGLRVDDNSQATVIDSQLINNSGYAISASPNTRLLGLTGLTVSGNGGGAKDGVWQGGGTVTSDVTWLPGITWFLEGNLTVGTSADPSPTLTIKPGVEVKADWGLGIWVNGTLSAVGTNSQPIVFTSKQTNPTAGYWKCIQFNATSSASQLTYATVSYAGHISGTDAAVYVDNAAPTMDHVTINNSASFGIHVVGSSGSPTVTNSTLEGSVYAAIAVDDGSAVAVADSQIINNSGYAFKASANSQISGLTGMTISGNGGGAHDGVYQLGGTITRNITWPGGVTWFLQGSLTVGTSADPSPTFTVDAGATVEVCPACWIIANGTLDAQGTAVAPVVFTSNQAAPTPGSWASLQINSTASASHLSYATVSYAGRGEDAAVYVNGSSPSFDHLTVSESSSHGMHVVGSTASPTVTNSTFESNTYAAIAVDDDATATVIDTQIVNNSGYAFKAWANSRILGLTGMTISGNGGGAHDGVYQLGGTITRNITWPGGVTWFLQGSLTVGTSADPSPTFTVDAGATVEVCPACWIIANGTLDAQGTAVAPVVFTSNQAAPTPGSWASLQINSTASASHLSYATVSYAGGAGGAAVNVNGGSPVLDHVTVTDSLTYALSVQNTSALKVTNCMFERNSSGAVFNQTPSQVIDARLSYWGSPSGPSGSGGGTGESVSAGVDYEPWLVASPSEPQFVSSALPVNRTFNPSLSIFNRLDFSTSLSGSWTLTFHDDGGNVVRTLSGQGTTGSATWDGKDNGGSALPDGTYTYDLASTAGSGQVATVAQGLAIIDSSRQLAISGAAISYAYFSPNGDGVQDETTYSGAFNFDEVSWQIAVKDSSGITVRTVSGQGSAFSFPWDGLSDTSQLEPDGSYTLAISATAGQSSASDTTSTVLDNTPPTAMITAPSATQVLSNVYQKGNMDISVIGSADDLNLLNWTLDYGIGQPPSAWTAISSAVTTAVTNGPLGTWDTSGDTNGEYELRLRVFDKAGNLSTVTLTPQVANFEVSQSVRQFNPSGGGTQSYVSTVPFALAETLTVSNEAGNVVRTLLSSTSRQAGSYTDVWDGTADNASLVPDGGYFYKATVTDGTHTLTWDLSSQYYSDNWWNNDATPLSSWDPLNNEPLKVPYNLDIPSRVTVAFSPTEMVPATCDPPNFCPLIYQYEESGAHAYYWAGVDTSDVYRTDIHGVVAFHRPDNFPKNAVVVYGTKAVINSLTVEPPVFSPDAGDQQVKLDFASYQSENVKVTLTFENLDSKSVLRTITVPSQAPGTASIPWDGRADNGVLAAPGHYLVTATIRDPRGGEVTRQIISTLRY